MSLSESGAATLDLDVAQGPAADGEALACRLIADPAKGRLDEACRFLESRLIVRAPVTNFHRQRVDVAAAVAGDRPLRPPQRRQGAGERLPGHPGVAQQERGESPLGQ